MTEIDSEAAEPLKKSSTFASKHSSSHHSGMESSVFRFKNIKFVAGKGDKQKTLLKNVSGTVKYGRKAF